MPTYRYRCGKCGEEFETWQSIKDDALHTHDRGCGGDLLKVLTPAGIVLKGSGFYKTDSRKSASDDNGTDKKPAKKDDSSSTSSESTPTPSSDSTKTSSSDGAKSSDTKKSTPSPTTP